MNALAVDVGGTHIGCGLVSGDRVIACDNVAVPNTASLEPLLPAVSRTLAALLGQAGLRPSDCAGIGVGFCGVVDPRRSRVISTFKYRDMVEFDLAAWAAAEFGLPLALQNDARVALLGERFAGAARGFDDVVMVTLGTGVGGVAMIGGRLLEGKHFQAGLLGGHIPVSFDGRQCACGAIGCVEAEASTWALPEICRSWPGFSGSVLARAEIDFAALFAADAAGDGVAAAVLRRCLRVWAAGIVGMIHSFDPEVVVIGGSVMKSGDRILPFLQEHIARHSWTPWGKVQLRAAALGEHAALLGAARLLQES